MHLARKFTGLGAFFVLVLISVTVCGQETGFSERLQQRLAQPGELRVAGERIVERTIVARLYEQNGYRPVWQNPRSVAALLAWVNRSREEGLDPADYHRSALERWAGAQPESVDQQVERELLFSDALLTLGIHLGTGKVNPGQLFKEWNYEMDYSQTPTSRDLLSSLERGDIDALFQGRLPKLPMYVGLRTVLARLREQQAAGGWPVVPLGPTLHPGDRSPRVKVLRERLLVTGELQSSSDDPEYFDEALAGAVKRFQADHLLDADGVVGKGTLAALNVPVQERIRQVRINLDRLRWVAHGLPEDYYLADLAGFQLYRSGSHWTSPIQVGQAYHQTPVFQDRIRIVEINPTWTVPMSITRRELAPRLLEDPLGYLKEKNMELLTPDGRPVDPSTVDWSNVTAQRFPYVLRQRPGPDNSLGRIKFLFPNQYAVYLHDTPSRGLFSRTRRAFSHGCVRVGKPLELGEQLLKPNGPEWTRQRIQQVIDSGETTRIQLTRPVPILILYLTAVTDGQGIEVQFRPDVYQRDAKVWKALESAPQEKGAEILEQFSRQRGQPW